MPIWDDGLDLKWIKDHPLMEIPLPLHGYIMTGIGDGSRKCGWGRTEPQNLVGYRLAETLRPLVEGDHIPGHLNRTYTVDYINRKGVCIIVRDHSFGRGLVRLILGWELIVTIPNEHANEFESVLVRRGHGLYVRSRLYRTQATAFNLESPLDMEHAVEAKMRLDKVGIVKSRLPLSREDCLVEDVMQYTEIR